MCFYHTLDYTHVCHQMGLVFVKPEPADTVLHSSRPNARKPRYVNHDLPLENRAQDLKVWQHKVLPSIIDWAGSLTDSFNATADPKFQHIINIHWRRSFPDIEPTEAVSSMVSTFSTCWLFELMNINIQAVSGLSNWRSGLGKRAVAWLQDLFLKEPYCRSKEAIIAYVRDNLANANFLYRDANVDLNVHDNNLRLHIYRSDVLLKRRGGVYRSPMILAVFSYHLRTILKTEATHGDPVGAMGVTAAAVSDN